MHPNNSFKVIIFDCDGVMFDSRQSNLHFYNDLLARFKLPPMDKEEIAFVHMATGPDALKHIFRKTPYFEEADNYRLQMDYTSFIKDMIMAPGLKNLLQKLQQAFLLALATNRSNTLGAVLEEYGLAGFFDMVVSSLDVKNPKPHPESLLKILRFFEIEPDEAVYIGDSIVDVDAARAAGVHFIAYGDADLGTDVRVRNMKELEKVLIENSI